jgi:hypothetical protein
MPPKPSSERNCRACHRLLTVCLKDRCEAQQQSLEKRRENARNKAATVTPAAAAKEEERTLLTQKSCQPTLTLTPIMTWIPKLKMRTLQTKKKSTALILMEVKMKTWKKRKLSKQTKEQTTITSRFESCCLSLRRDNEMRHWRTMSPRIPTDTRYQHIIQIK